MTISGKSSVTAVIGGNISGSLSPVIHNLWYHDTSIDGVYIPLQVTEADFKDAATGLFKSGLKGMNVTVPLKEEAFKFADILTPEAEKAEAVNCLYIQGGKIVGHNTDGIGFTASVTALDPNFNFEAARILLLGAGGAAAGIVSGLIDLGVKKFDILNRTFSKAQALVGQFSRENLMMTAFDTPKQLVTGYDLIINTTTLKSTVPNGLNDLPVNILKQSHLVIDINYGFSPNEFLDKAKKNGCLVCDGIEMLIQQARPSFALFNQTDIPDVTKGLYQSLNKMMGV